MHQCEVLAGSNAHHMVAPPARYVVGRAPARDRGRRQVQLRRQGGSAAAAIHDLVNCLHGRNNYDNRIVNASLITKYEIDAVEPLALETVMLTHDQLRAELIRQIDERLVKQADVARALSTQPSRIAEVRKGSRRIQPEEMPKLAAFLGLTDSDEGKTVRIARTVQIPHLGKVAAGIWLEQTVVGSQVNEFVPYDVAFGDPGVEDLFAVTPEGDSMNRVFSPGMRLICRRVSFGSGQFRSGDYVIVERTAHDLRELTCKKVVIDESGQYWLQSETTNPKFQEPWLIGMPDSDHHDDTEISIIGKVIRGVVDFGE